jgi:hypothetical protein
MDVSDRTAPIKFREMRTEPASDIWRPSPAAFAMSGVARSARVEMGGRRRARGYLTSVNERKGHPRRGWPFDRDFRRRLPYILECETATFAGAHPNRTVFGLGPGSGLADGASPSSDLNLHPCDDRSVVDAEKVPSMRATGVATPLLRAITRLLADRTPPVLPWSPMRCMEHPQGLTPRIRSH